LPVGPTGSVPIRVIRPVGAAEVLPAVMYFHGGGWLFGDEEGIYGRPIGGQERPALRCDTVALARTDFGSGTV
jgi:hypothetical protein